MLKHLGVAVQINGLRVSLEGRTPFHGGPLSVPGDLSAAAFFLVAGSIVPDSELFLPGIGMNPERIGIVETLQQMGANIEVQNSREESGEPVADLLVKSARLHAVHLGADQIPKTVDELPILCIAAAVAEGETCVTGAEELRVKESDRIRTMATELRQLGVSIEETRDGLRIQGGAEFSGWPWSQLWRSPSRDVPGHCWAGGEGSHYD